MGKQARLRRERRQAGLTAAEDTALFIDVYEDVAPGIIYRHFSADCCTNATRVLMDVGEAFGVQVTPMVCRTIVMNAKQLELLKAHGTFPTDNALLASWRELGAYSVVIDTLEDAQAHGKENGRGWHGHLVGVAGGKLIDSSARQFSRPQRNMEYPDIAVMQVPANFTAGGSMSGILPNGVSCYYTAMPSVRRFESQPGFHRHEGNMDVARVIILAMDQKMPPGWRARSRPKLGEA